MALRIGIPPLTQLYFPIISKLTLQVVTLILLRPLPLPILSMVWIHSKPSCRQNFRRL